VFKDTDTIAPGTDYALVIQEALTRTDVVVALIGPAWSDIRDDDGDRRLDNPSDLVRHELEVALERRVPILPVLVNKATMPAADELPERLRGLAAKQALRLNDDTWRATVKGSCSPACGSSTSSARPPPRSGGHRRRGRVRAVPASRTSSWTTRPPRGSAPRDTEAGRRVVLEVRARSDGADGRFDDTAAALATIDDPHLVPVLGGEVDGRSYLVSTEPVRQAAARSAGDRDRAPRGEGGRHRRGRRRRAGVLRAAAFRRPAAARRCLARPERIEASARALLPFGAFPAASTRTTPHPSGCAASSSTSAPTSTPSPACFRVPHRGPPYPARHHGGRDHRHLNKPRPT
jgi:hypothetical protein